MVSVKYLKVPVLVLLLLTAYVLGSHHGYALGVADMGSIAGPALLQCVNLLAGKGYLNGR